MKNSISSVFIYPYAFKFVGVSFIVFGLITFFYRIKTFNIMDIVGGSFPVAIGLIMIFFSRERVFDERVAFLKFKALAIAVPVAAMAVMLINYYYNFDNYSIETDNWYSISAFEYLTIALVIANLLFYYLTYRE